MREGELMAQYQELASQLTLKEALAEYHELNSKILYKREMSSDSEVFFGCHDIAHVVFACDTSLLNEGMVKMWTAFGTTLGFWKHIAAYSREETYEIVNEISWKLIIVTSFQSLIIMPRVLSRCLAMKKRWPWSSFEEYFNVPLVEIRTEFNIQPLIVA